MHIQQVVVDGFKSYARKTVIDGFDPHFNAITGLNGSGKSNILDSICFVLGISNLSAVRAGNLSELVYKQGQAGVTRASVTIIFSNRDPSTSPVGYESVEEVTVTRQVLLGGKSKYMINGKVQTMTQVTNLFHSVQLNVNNPHFLIMQGRITKVLNMKPAEILSMVEEAAGTRMYERQRLAAIKTISKKQLKLDELNNILESEITPTLERLRGEKHHYLKWSKNGADIERMERFVVAYDYCHAIEVVKKSDGGIEGVETEITASEELEQELQKSVDDVEAEMSTLSNELSGDVAKRHKEAKSDEDRLSQALVKINTKHVNAQTAVKEADADRVAAAALVEETQGQVETKSKDVDNQSRKLNKLLSTKNDAETEFERLTNDYQNMCAGIKSSEDEDESGGTLPDRISQAHKDAKYAEGRVKQSQMTVTHLSKQLKGLKKEMQTEESNSKSLTKKRDTLSQNLAKLHEALKKLPHDDASSALASLETKKSCTENTLQSLRDRIGTIEAQLSARLTFEYSDPVRGFDRSKVKGLVARLVKVKEERHSVALEVVAGDKLFQVVVDDAITGKALIEKGKLLRRCTIIPLDKIQSRRIPSAMQQTATSIVKKTNPNGESIPAIELLGFDEEVRNAMEYIFGGTLIVDGMDAADQICKMTRVPTVTMEGDVFSPDGTISGGSKGNFGTTLRRLTELASLQSELASTENTLRTLNKEWKSLSVIAEQHLQLSDKCELAQAELSAAEKHLSQTSYGLLKEKHDAMVEEVEAAKVEMETMTKEKEEKWELYKELKSKEADLTKEREVRLKKMEEGVKVAKKRAGEVDKEHRKAESAFQKLSLELQNLKNDVIAAEEAAKSAEKVLHDAQSHCQALEDEVTQEKTLYDEAKTKLDDIEKELSTITTEIKSLTSKKNRLSKQKTDAELSTKKLQIKLSKYVKDKDQANRFVLNMINKHPWIESEKSRFGVPNGDYDFTSTGGTDPATLSAKLKALKEEQSSLSKKINKKVMGMIEKAEGEYTELLRKRKVVENDKKKIETVIDELDTKKKTELERTWRKVNDDFGSIFSTLLPGAKSKLEPPEGLRAWEGLEVKVAFGDVWKESLSELSGGQRSLLALSLILSMLLFKPAPMYILDEVDAALDLSHTQNIGQMLKTHFSQSQFIVVSLKEGMFNNANVIFRTKFVDGVSTVTRTLGIGASSKGRALEESNRESRSSNNDDVTRKRSVRRRTANSVDKEN